VAVLVTIVVMMVRWYCGRGGRCVIPSRHRHPDVLVIAVMVAVVVVVAVVLVVANVAVGAQDGGCNYICHVADLFFVVVVMVTVLVVVVVVVVSSS
jgi:hypothetical protein